MRWAIILQQYSFEIEYIKGESNAADLFSRPVCSITHRSPSEKLGVEDLETQKKLLREYHIALGHGSKSNMKFALSLRYTWPTLFKDIDSLVDNCMTCKLGGGPVQNTKNRILQSDRPNQLWEIDILGPLPKTPPWLQVYSCMYRPLHQVH